jgi:hypothetical protein
MPIEQLKSRPEFKDFVIKHWPNTKKFSWRGREYNIEKLTSDEVLMLAADKAFPHWTLKDEKGSVETPATNTQPQVTKTI